ncbi:Transposon TX1 uncharacterized 149 kDa protein [Linum grandiflorum]
MLMTSLSEAILLRPWRFELMWLQHDNFKSFLGQVWSTHVEGYGGLYLLAKRLKLVKEKLKAWNKDVFKCNESEIARCVGLNAELDFREDSGNWSEALRVQRCLIKFDLDKLWKRQETSWRQKSRETNLRLGDRNTTFFHKVASHNRRRNMVEKLTVDRVVFEGHGVLGPAIVGYYERLYSEDISSRPFPMNLGWPTISREDAELLVRQFTVGEIKKAVMSCARDKAPGPDGFNMDFFKHNWEEVKDQVVSALIDFHLRSSMPLCVNSTFECLIPKKETVEDVKDFRPIRLTSSIYKIISNVLMERLRGLMPTLVSKNQCAFVHGRQILDASLIANELVDSRRRSGRPGLVIKLDIEKAYDHVNWNCVLHILHTLWFSEKWIGWIQACICTPAFSILVNGEAAGFFQSSRGLRQGDSLSPFLFILVMDVLSAIFEVLKTSNIIKGFFMNEDAGLGEVTHLLYADDTILFCEASAQQVQGVLAALIVFQAITGLKVNLNKCSISVVGEVPNALQLADILGCAVESFPCSYLGLPLGSRAICAALWDPVVSKVQNRLETWKTKHLSFGGRMVLIKSVLSSMPVYFLSVFRAPATVIKVIERIQNNFLLTGLSVSSKMHMISWDKVKTPMRRGGLGVTDLESLNKALLGKWLWRFGTERAAWWRILIEVKYGLERGSDWRSTCYGISSGWSVWVWIWKLGSEFWDLAYVDPGGGDWVRSWHDVWVPGKLFARDFPRVAAAVQIPEAFITDLYYGVDRNQWTIGLSISLRGGALEELNRLQELLQNLPPDIISSGPPRLRWRHDERNGFSVHSFKSSLLDSKFPGADDYPASTVWVSTVPTKVCCFVWLASNNSIATMDNLHRRGCVVPNRCVLCCVAEESVSHLLLHCSFSNLVWFRLCRVWGDFAPLPSDVLHVLKGWKDGNCVASFGRFRRVVCHSIWWFIWLERNDRIF